MAFQMLHHDKHTYFSVSFSYYLYLQFRSFNVLNKKSYSCSINNSYASFQNSINNYILLPLPRDATAFSRRIKIFLVKLNIKTELQKAPVLSGSILLYSLAQLRNIR
jgi:hypothetical protein